MSQVTVVPIHITFLKMFGGNFLEQLFWKRFLKTVCYMTMCLQPVLKTVWALFCWKLFLICCWKLALETCLKTCWPTCLNYFGTDWNYVGPIGTGRNYLGTFVKRLELVGY